MARPSVGLPFGGWGAWQFDYGEQPHSSSNGRPRQYASAPAFEPAPNDIDFQLAGAIFDSNTGATQSHDGPFGTTPQTLQTFNEDASDGARFIGEQQPHRQNDPTTAPLYNIQSPQWPTVEEVSELYTYDNDGLAPHNIRAAHHLQVPSHHSQSDVETASRTSAHAAVIGTQVLTFGDQSVCNICQARFTGKFARGNCARHIRILHAERSAVLDPKLVCRKCSKHFKRQDATIKHEKRKHGLQGSGPRRRSGARSTSHQTNDNFSDHGTSVCTGSILEVPDTVEMTRRTSQQIQMQIPDRTRLNAPCLRTSYQTKPTSNHAGSPTTQQLHPRQRNLRLHQPPVTDAADFDLLSNQSVATMDMAQILPSDPGTHPSGQEMYSNGFSPFMASSHTSYAPVNHQAADKNTSDYLGDYAHSLEPPSPWQLESNWSPTFDNQEDVPYPPQLSRPVRMSDYEFKANFAHSSFQHHGF